MRKVVTGAKHPVAAFFHLLFKVRGRVKQEPSTGYLIHAIAAAL